MDTYDINKGKVQDAGVAQGGSYTGSSCVFVYSCTPMRTRVYLVQQVYLAVSSVRCFGTVSRKAKLTHDPQAFRVTV